MNARETIELYGTIADMKENGYRNTLAVTALIELLIDKGLFTRDEFAAKAAELDQVTSVSE